MKEWIKKIVYTPIDYGINLFNVTVTEFVTTIFNLYGKRIFKIENDKIIERNEYVDDRNYLYMYPIKLKNIEQTFGLNSLKIIDGTVQNLVVSVPWKQLMNSCTYVNIDNIDIQISLDKNENSVYFSNLESANSYLFNSDSFIEKGNQDLIDTFLSIKNAVTKYINKIEICVKKICIVMNENLNIVVTDTVFKENSFDIKEILILSNTKNVLACIKNTHFSDSSICISDLNINTNMFSYIPIIYTDNTKSDFHINVNIETTNIDMLKIEQLDFQIDSYMVVVNNISSLQMENIMIIVKKEENKCVNKNLIVYDTVKRIATINQCFNIKIFDINELITYVNNILPQIKKISEKFVVIDYSIDDSSCIDIVNIKMNIVYGDDNAYIQVDTISIDVDVHITNFLLTHRDNFILIENINVLQNKNICIDNLSLNTNEFKTYSKNIFVDNFDKKCNNISFTDAKTTQVVKLVEFIVKIVDLISDINGGSTVSDNKTTTTNLHFSNCDIDVNIADNNSLGSARVNIVKTTLCLTEKNVKNLEVNMYVMELLIGTVKTKYLDSQNFIFDKIVFFVDIKLVDILNMFINNFKFENNNSRTDGIVNLQTILLDTVNFSDMLFNYQSDYMQSSYNINKVELDVTTHMYPQISFLMNSYHTIGCDITESYHIKQKIDTPEFKIAVKKIYIYLFDKLQSVPNYDKSSIFFVMKDISIDKITKYIHLDSNLPSFSIVEGVRRKKSNVSQIYSLKISSFYAIDTKSTGYQWRYFIKCNRNTALTSQIIVCDECYKISSDISSLTVNIRENTLLHLLTFFTQNQNKKENTNIFIENFILNQFSININFYPLLAETYASDKLSISNFIINLSSLRLNHINGLDKLVTRIVEIWKKDINSDNYLQIIPNIKILTPYTTPTINFMNLISTYFSNPAYQLKVRKMMKNISNSSLLSMLIKTGKKSVLELFNH